MVLVDLAIACLFFYLGIQAVKYFITLPEKEKEKDPTNKEIKKVIKDSKDLLNLSDEVEKIDDAKIKKTKKKIKQIKGTK